MLVALLATLVLAAPPAGPRPTPRADEPELKIIDVFICKLRKKLSLACEGDNYIETVWGRGYVLRDPQEVTATQVA